MKKIMNAAGVVAASLTLMAGSALAQDPDLVVFDWPGYEDPEFFGAYTEKHGAEPTFAFFGEEEEAFQKLLKVSGRTKQNNKTREITLPDYFVCAAYVAHVRLLERDGKNPGWRKLEKRVTDILGRSPHRRDEWKHLVTKSRFDKLLPIFRKLTQEPGYATPERVVEATQFDWLTQ